VVTWVPGLWDKERPIQPDAIEGAEQALGIAFPKSYCLVAAEHQGMQPQPDRFDFVEDGEQTESVMGPLFHFLDTDDPNDLPDYHIVANYRLKRQALPAQVIPFSQDPGGNAIAFDYRKADAEPPVVFVDHEADDDNCVWPIAATFSELLEQLHS
jgi:hypothetical protein